MGCIDIYIRRVFWFITIVIVSQTYLLAQESEGTFQGIILDEESKLPIQGIQIVWIDEEEVERKGAISDANGRFKIEGVKAGTQTFVFASLGYKQQKREFGIRGGHETNVEIILEISPLDLASIEVIGTTNNAIQKLPGTGTKLDKQFIQLTNPVGTQEILSKVPGIHGFADDGMGNSRLSIGIRGLSPRRSSRVLVLEDGIPIQPAIYVYPNMYYNPPVERLDEIEIIKGSGAIRYGPQTMGGVINYITKRPRTELGGGVQLTGGTNYYASILAEVGGFGNEKIHPELQFLYKRGDGYRENNSFEQFNTTFKVNFFPTINRSLYLKANINHELSNATYTGLTEYSFGTSPRFNPKKDDEFKVFRTALDMIYLNQISSRLLSNTKLYLSYFDRRWWRENDIFVTPTDFEQGNLNPVPWYTPGPLVRTGNGQDNFGILRTFYIAGVEHTYDFEYKINQIEANLEAGARVHFERFIDDKKTGFAPDAREGVYFTADSVDGEEVITVLGQSHHYETLAFSAFATQKLTFWHRLDIRLGLRFEVFEQERIDRLNGSTYRDKTTAVLLPGIGLNYKANEHIYLFAGVHRGFTPPSSGTLKVLNFGLDTDQGLDLRAEKSWNSEVGLRGEYGFLRFELALFDMRIEDLVAAGRGTAFKNLGQVSSSGIELMFHSNFSELDNVKFLPDFFLTYTFMNTNIQSGTIKSSQVLGDVDISGNDLPYAPPHALNVGVMKSFDFGLSLGIDVKFVDEVYTDFENIIVFENRGDQGSIPSYYLLNANVRYRLNKNWTFFANGKNLLDEIYIGSRLHSNPGQPEANLSSGILPGPRRQINLGLKYTFGENR